MLRTGALFRVAMLLALGFMGCGKGGGDESTAGKRQFSECCSRDADCDSGVCGRDQGVCTVECTTDDDCPAEPKSGKPDCKTSEGVCQAEREGVECEPDDGGSNGGSSSAGSAAGGKGGSSSGGSGASSTGGKGGSTAEGGKSGSGGSAGTSGASNEGLGIGEPCSTQDECRSGICYRPGGPPGFCTTTCSVSFDAACLGDGEGGDTLSGEIVYCMPFGNGGRCYPGCINSDICTDYAGMFCAHSVKDIADYNGNVCQERL